MLLFIVRKHSKKIDHSLNNESAKSLCIIFNANNTATPIIIPDGSWNVYVRGDKAGTEILKTIKGGSIMVDPISALVLSQPL